MLDAYLARIGLDAAPSPDADGLAAIQRAHRLAIPFENLDIPIGRGISLDPAAIDAKIVGRRRGGYCFEQNQLFLRALREIGFDARALMARVWLGAEETPPLTHTLNLVMIDGEPWIADAGFGGSYSPPMRLVADSERAAPDGTRHRLSRDETYGWMLERRGDPAKTDGRGAGAPGWLRQYSFTLATVWPVDLAVGNHFTSTAPGTRFTTLKVVSRASSEGFVSLTDRHFTRRQTGSVAEHDVVDAAEYRALLADVFGIALDEDEIVRLGLFPAG